MGGVVELEFCCGFVVVMFYGIWCQQRFGEIDIESEGDEVFVEEVVVVVEIGCLVVVEFDDLLFEELLGKVEYEVCVGDYVGVEEEVGDVVWRESILGLFQESLICWWFLLFILFGG